MKSILIKLLCITVSAVCFFWIIYVILARMNQPKAIAARSWLDKFCRPVVDLIKSIFQPKTMADVLPSAKAMPNITEQAIVPTVADAVQINPDQATSTSPAISVVQPGASFDSLPIALAASSQEQVDRQTDEIEFQSLFDNAKFWNSRASTLEAAVGIAYSEAEQIVASGRNALNGLPSALQDSLKVRQEGIELILRMLSRLPVVMQDIKTDLDESVMLPEPFGVQAWADFLRDVADENEANISVKRKINELGNARYRSINDMRDLAQKIRQRVLQSVARKMLPIIDGLDDGELHSDEIINTLKTGLDGKYIKLFDDWLAGYGKLRNNVLLVMLEKIRIRPMTVTIGNPIDYEQHEPVDSVADLTLQNEAVKEVMRAGYIYETFIEDEIAVLRAAQVIIVKNLITIVKENRGADQVHL